MDSNHVTRAMSIIAAASLVAQAAFFVGFGFLVADLLSLRNVVTPEMGEGSRVLVRYVQETVASYQAVLWTGFIGALAWYLIYLRQIFRARWYLTGTRVLGWMWLLLLPIGTGVGIVLISWI